MVSNRLIVFFQLVWNKVYYFLLHSLQCLVHAKHLASLPLYHIMCTIAHDNSTKSKHWLNTKYFTCIIWFDRHNNPYAWGNWGYTVKKWQSWNSHPGLHDSPPPRTYPPWLISSLPVSSSLSSKCISCSLNHQHSYKSHNLKGKLWLSYQ